MSRLILDCSNVINSNLDLFFSSSSIINEIDDYYYNYDNEKKNLKKLFTDFILNKYKTDIYFKNRYDLYGEEEIEYLLYQNKSLFLDEKRNDIKYYVYKKIKNLEKIVILELIIIISFLLFQTL